MGGVLSTQVPIERKIPSTPFCRSLELHRAAGWGDLEDAKAVLDKKPPIDPLIGVNAIDGSFKTPLHRAAEKGKVDMICFLLERGAEIHAFTNGFKTPLHLASRFGMTDACICLLDHGADPYIKDKQDRSPLDLAAENGHINTVMTLVVKKRVKILPRPRNCHYSILNMALFERYEQFAMILINSNEVNVNENEKNDRSTTPLHIACQGGMLSIVRALIAKGANIKVVRDDGFYPLSLAAMLGHLHIVQCLVGEHNADVNCRTRFENQSTPLMLASAAGHLEVVIYLVEKGAKIEAKGVNDRSWPLTLAMENNNIEVALYLLDQGADYLKKGTDNKSCLDHAISLEDPRVFYKLMMLGLDVNGQESDPNLTENSLLIRCLNERHGCLYALELIEMGANVNVVNNLTNATPLHLVCRKQLWTNLDRLLSALVEKGVDVNARDNGGMTPLHYSCRHLQLEEIKFLIENGADINARDNCGVAPLHCCCERLQLEEVKYLIENGADINAKDSYNYTPLMSVVSKEDILHYVAKSMEIIRFLLERGAVTHERNDAQETLLHMICKNPFFCIVALLLEGNVDIHARDTHQRTCLHNLCSRSDVPLDVMNLLVERGADVNAVDDEHRTPLHILIARSECQDAMIFLMNNGADLEVKDGQKQRTALLRAFSLNKPKYAKLLIERGANVHTRDNDGVTPLHMACRWIQGNINFLKMLVNRGADVNARDNHLATPLIRAIENSNHKNASYLIAMGADVKLADVNHISPLLLACERRGLKCASFITSFIKLLIEHGADVKAKGARDMTALHYIIDYDIRCIRMIVEAGADVNAKNVNECTPFHLLCRNISHLYHTYEDRREAFEYMIEKGANIEMTDGDGHTALLRALKDHDNELAWALIEAGADVNAKGAVDLKTPLHRAATAFSNPEVGLKLIQELLKRGANPNAKDHREQTPLHAAINLDFAMELVRCGSNIRAKDETLSAPHWYRKPLVRTTFDRLWYNTNLMQAMMDDQLNIFGLLLKNRSIDVNEDIGIVGDSGWTVLDAAVYLDKIDYVQLLIDSHHPVKLDQGALHIACGKNHKQMARYLATCMFRDEGE